MEAKRRCVLIPKARFRVGQHVYISKETIKFAKGAEQNFSTEIFRIATVIERRPRSIYELEDLNRKPTDGQYNQEELTSRNGPSKINKILDKRVRHGIREYLVRSRGYSSGFDLFRRFPHLVSGMSDSKHF